MCHTTFHSLLRSSSMPEPRRPPRRCLWKLGWGLGRRGASRHFCGVTAEERHSAPSSLVRPHPPCVLCLLRSLRAPQRAPPSECAPPKDCSGSDCPTPSPRVFLLLCFLLLLEPPASPLRRRRPGADDDVVIVVCRRPPSRDGQLTSIMILLQVLLQKPCYDFSFL